MVELTFLEEKDLFGDNQLEVIKKRGKRAVITDFAISQGGYVSDYTIDKSSNLNKRIGYYWTKTAKNKMVTVVDPRGIKDYEFPSMRASSIRLVLELSSIILDNEIRRRANDGIIEIQLGHYPSNAVSHELQNKLELIYRYNGMNKTGNSYTVDERNQSEIRKKFTPQTYEEYDYEGQKFVRVKMNSCFEDENIKLSNGQLYKNGDYVWISVEPVIWLLDEKTQKIITEELICAGVQFKHSMSYNGNFNKTTIKKFINTYLINDLFQTQQVNFNQNADVMQQYSRLIRKLQEIGYSEEQIKNITYSILSETINDTKNNKTKKVEYI